MIIDGQNINRNFKDSCDVCVIGSGAGGAVVAKELAEGGLKVIVLEEGKHFTKKDFNGNSLEMSKLLYRDNGITSSLGNATIVIPMGRCIGGTTTINAGTCFRTPQKLLQKWYKEGSVDLNPDEFNQYFEKVERFLNVEESPINLLGNNNLTILNGAKKLGFKCGPLKRNAPGCKGTGICIFGCPEDAKKSTNISYIPKAIEYGAKVYTLCKAERIIVEKGVSKGVEGIVLEDGNGKAKARFKINAKIVVLSAGTILSPILLKKNRIANSSGEVGKNLHLHTATRGVGIYDENINGWRGIVQGVYVDFYDEGIMLETVFVPPNMLAPSLPSFGDENRVLMSRYRNSSVLGGMISDTSSGRVWGMVKGFPIVSYNINKFDAQNIKRAVGLMSRIHFSAGAKEVFTGIHHWNRLKSLKDVEEMEKDNIKANQLEVMSMHPHGTCRMGNNPKTSVVSTKCESHDIKNLYICDGSVLPSSLGVNPQITIMTISTMASDYILKKGI